MNGIHDAFTIVKDEYETRGLMEVDNNGVGPEQDGGGVSKDFPITFVLEYFQASTSCVVDRCKHDCTV